MSAPTYTIGLFDDHPIVTDGMLSVLSGKPEFNVQLVANTREDLLEQLETTSLDVLILDVIAPNITGLDLFKTVRNTYPAIRIIAYTSLTSTILIDNLLITGVSGYINKRQPPAEIYAAVLRVCEGGIYVPDDYRHLLEGLLHKNPLHLTQKEQEILKLILKGKISKEIAAGLKISQNTVENHRTSLFKKFEVTNLAELYRKSTGMGYSAE